MLIDKRPLLPERMTYRPMSHPELFEAFKQQIKMFWLPEEVPMANDVKDMGPNGSMSDDEKEIIKMILRFFTQGDIRIAEYYLHDIIPVCKIPEAQMCFTGFAFFECIHISAYAHLNDTLGLPEHDFSSFLEYEEMVRKLDILDHVSNKEDALVKLGVFSGFMEGVSLFGSFALLLNMSRFGLMPGVGQIVSWSIRDENLHISTMCWFYNRLVSSLSPEERARVEGRIVNCGKQLVEAEFKFIDLLLGDKKMRGINKEELKDFVLVLANKRLGMLGIAPEFSPKTSKPLQWFWDLVTVPESTNFFEGRVTSYERASSEWDDNDD